MSKDIHIIRESIGRIVALLTNQRIPVTQRGSQAYVRYDPSGKVVAMNIPYLPDDATPEFVAAVQGFLDHEVGHVLHSHPQAAANAAKLGEKVANVANIIEDVFIERKMAETFEGSGLNLENTRRFFIEKMARPKIEEAMARGDLNTAAGSAGVIAFRAWGGQTAMQDYLAANPKVAKLVEPMKAKLGPALIARIGKCNTSAECLALAKDFVSALAAPKPKPKPPAPPPPAPAPPPPKPAAPPVPDDEEDEGEQEKGETPAPEGDEGEDGAPAAQPAGDSDEEANEEGGTPLPADTGDGDDEPESQDDPADFGNPTGNLSDDPADQNDEPGAPQDDDSEGTGAAQAGPSDDEGGAGPEEKPDATSGGARMQQSDGEGTPGPGHLGDDPDAPDEDAEQEEATVETEPDPLDDAFKEKNDFDEGVAKALSAEAVKQIGGADYAVFSTDWDQVVPYPEKGSDESVERMVDSANKQISVMQKSLERAIAAKARVTWNPGQRRGHIAPGNLYRAGMGDDRVFRQRYETRAKNTAVTMLVDCSGSMHGEKINLAGQAAFALASTLERIRVQCEVIGFTTVSAPPDMKAAFRSEPTSMQYGRQEPLYMPVFKGFNEKLDPTTRGRIAHLTESPMWCRVNVDGESLRVAAQRLKQQRVERRILIVLSDGMPAANPGYGLNDHLSLTVKALEKEGIDVIGLGILSDAVNQFYRKHVVLNKIDDLPTTVIAQISAALLS